MDVNEQGNNRLLGVGICLGLAAGVVLFQIGFAALLSPGKNLAEIYASFCTWDCIWYKDIATQGYFMKVPVELWTFGLGNVAFFPGLPLAASGLIRLGMQSEYAVVITSQIACWGWWIYVFLLWRRWRVPWLLQALTLTIMLAHPAAFFLVMGYSESLFLLGLGGFLFWLGSPTPLGRFLAAVHGWWMTATRIVGLPLAFLPLAQRVLAAARDPRCWRWIGWDGLVSLVAASGTLLFFLFCWWQFGHWDLYAQIQLKGWNMKPLYGALFRWSTYQIPPLDGDPQVLMNRLATTLTLAFVGGMTLLDGLGILLHRWFARIPVSQGWQERVMLYGAAWMMLVVSIAGLANLNMQSMIRYTMPVVMVMALGVSHYGTHLPGEQPRWVMALVVVLLMLVAGGLLCAQGILVMRFTRSQWVA